MNHADGVCRGQRFAYLCGQFDGLTDVERLVALTRRNILAVQPLHGDVGLARLLEGAVRDQAHDSGMVQLAEQLPFAGHARGLFLVSGDVRRHHLERNGLVLLKISRTVHHTGATPSDLLFDDESAADLATLFQADDHEETTP